MAISYQISNEKYVRKIEIDRLIKLGLNVVIKNASLSRDAFLMLKEDSHGKMYKVLFVLY